MKVLIAPNAFKGNLNALQVAEAIEQGLKKGCPTADPIRLPIADGGEGTVDICVAASGGEIRTCKVHNAVGDLVDARYGILADGRTAVLELAAASGIGQLEKNKLSPMKASTFGTGELIKDALDQGCRRIIIGLGGSATNDVGTGILRALGARFLNESGYEIPEGGGGLGYLHEIDLKNLDTRIRECEFILPCDVANPLLGPEGSAAVFSPQKGATAEQVEMLETHFAHFNELVKKNLSKDLADLKFGGAAGGTSAGLFAFLDAKLISGIDFLLHQIDFDQKLHEADFLITAEGRLDQQSLEGKGPYGVAVRAARRGIPAFCITGQVPLGLEADTQNVFQAIFPIPTKPMSLDEAKEDAEALISFSAWQIGRMLALNN